MSNKVKVDTAILGERFGDTLSIVVGAAGTADEPRLVVTAVAGVSDNEEGVAFIGALFRSLADAFDGAPGGELKAAEETPVGLRRFNPQPRAGSSKQ